MTSPHPPASRRPGKQRRETERPEGDMAVGSTSIALGGTPNPDATGTPSAPDAPPTGSGSVGDDKHDAAASESNSGTSSTSVGTASGGSG